MYLIFASSESKLAGTLSVSVMIFIWLRALVKNTLTRTVNSVNKIGYLMPEDAVTKTTTKGNRCFDHAGFMLPPQDAIKESMPFYEHDMWEYFCDLVEGLPGTRGFRGMLDPGQKEACHDAIVLGNEGALRLRKEYFITNLPIKIYCCGMSSREPILLFHAPKLKVPQGPVGDHAVFKSNHISVGLRIFRRMITIPGAGLFLRVLLTQILSSVNPIAILSFIEAHSDKPRRCNAHSMMWPGGIREECQLGTIVYKAYANGFYADTRYKSLRELLPMVKRVEGGKSVYDTALWSVLNFVYRTILLLDSIGEDAYSHDQKIEPHSLEYSAACVSSCNHLPVEERRFAASMRWKLREWDIFEKAK